VQGIEAGGITGLQTLFAEDKSSDVSLWLDKFLCPVASKMQD